MHDGAGEIDRRTLFRNDPRADQVHFVGDQNDRHLATGLVVIDVVQKVDGQFVRLPVLHRIHDDDGGDVIAAAGAVVVVVVLKRTQNNALTSSLLGRRR